MARSPGRPARTRVLFWSIIAGTLLLGSTAAIIYAQQQLTLSHYDARGHLVVARRIIDSLTPGWRQIGAVWLPLPHVLNMVPVQIDWSYRTGFSAVAISIFALAWGLASLALFILRRSGSVAASIAAPVLILLNPNVLYLQSTAMTEPLLLGLSFVSLDAVDRFLETGRAADRTRAGLALAALVLTRYEGWCIGAALVGVVLLARWREAPRDLVRLASYPVAAIAGFLLLGRVATGAWFTASGFFVPENPALHDPLLALDQVFTGTRELGGLSLVIAGGVGVAVCLWFTARALNGGADTAARAALPLALLAAAALPWLAFVQGHPLRVRYMVPLVAASAVLAAVAIGAAPRRLGAIAAALLVTVSVSLMPPLDATAKMVVEAQWETPFRRGREAVTRYLAVHHDGTPVLASMGSLAHYMQETSSIGLEIRHFVHEGNGDLWAAALASPRRHVRWVLIEERAEGGDALALRARDNPAFLDGLRRVAEGGGLALYARE